MTAALRDVVVGRIGKPHGLKGQVTVEVRTDEPERRFRPGSVLATERPPGSPARPGVAAARAPGSLTITAVHWHGVRLLLTFAEVADRTAAEAVRGLLLHALVDPHEAPGDPEEFYDHQLVGAAVVTVDERHVGTIGRVVHAPAQDLLSIVTPDHGEVLVPFVAALVPNVDVEAGVVMVADVPGLLEPDQPDAGGHTAEVAEREGGA